MGEGTTDSFPQYILKEMKLNPATFYAEASPTWKLGLHFLWGPRKHFIYNFTNQFDERWPGLRRNNGYYCEDSVDDLNLNAALHLRNKVFPRRLDGWPDLSQQYTVAYHIENAKLVKYLENRCLGLGATIRDGTVQHAERDDHGIKALILEDGTRVTGDLFVDASGFRGELIFKALKEPWHDYSNALFCDRAVIGGWERTNEIIQPYTVCETMDSGWAWRIDHENFINRGYVFASRFISDEQAREELLRKNPKIPPDRTRVVKFRSGRAERLWVQNVVTIGNASGFVEPLEATALARIIDQTRAMVSILIDSDFEVPPGYVDLFNRMQCYSWDQIRDFIALHYKFNTRLDTPFWKLCIEDTPLGDAQGLADFYMANGPTVLHRHTYLPANHQFGIEGYLALLIGQKVPYKVRHNTTADEIEALNGHRKRFGAIADKAFTVRDALDALRKPSWRWS